MKKETFINNFERLRKQAGLSRKKVFEDLGLSQSLFTNWKKQNKQFGSLRKQRIS